MLVLAAILLDLAAADVLYETLFSCFASEITALEAAVFQLKSLKSEICFCLKLTSGCCSTSLYSCTLLT